MLGANGVCVGGASVYVGHWRVRGEHATCREPKRHSAGDGQDFATPPAFSRLPITHLRCLMAAARSAMAATVRCRVVVVGGCVCALVVVCGLLAMCVTTLSTLASLT